MERVWTGMGQTIFSDFTSHHIPSDPTERFSVVGGTQLSLDFSEGVQTDTMKDRWTDGLTGTFLRFGLSFFLLYVEATVGYCLVCLSVA